MVGLVVQFQSPVYPYNSSSGSTIAESQAGTILQGTHIAVMAPLKSVLKSKTGKLEERQWFVKGAQSLTWEQDRHVWNEEQWVVVLFSVRIPEQEVI